MTCVKSIHLAAVWRVKGREYGTRMKEGEQ